MDVAREVKSERARKIRKIKKGEDKKRRCKEEDDDEEELGSFNCYTQLTRGKIVNVGT